jgi:prolyl oligopeptidase
MRRSCVLLVAAAACGAPRSAPKPVEANVSEPPIAPLPAPAVRPVKDYPATRRDDVVDTIHGVAVHDPYRWLEDPSKPEVQDWMKAEDAYTRERLAKLPLRDALAARFAEVFYYDAVTAPVHRADRFFYTRKHKDREKAIVYWKQGERGAEHVLLDPNTWSADGSSGLKGWRPSWDGRHVAYNKSEHNADETTMYVIDVAKGTLLKDTIPGTKYGAASWTPDGRGFYYIWVPAPSAEVPVADRPGFAELRYHALGTDPAKDPVVHAKTGDPHTFLTGGVSMDGHWLFASIQHGWTSSDWYFQDLRAKHRAWTPLVEGVDALFSVDAWKDRFYVTTNDGAPHYRVLAVDPKHPAREAWKEIVPEGPDRIEDTTIAGGRLVLTYLKDAASVVELHGLDGARLGAVAIPPLGTVDDITARPDDDTAYVSYTSFREPQVIYKTAIAGGKVDEWARVALPVDTR